MIDPERTSRVGRLLTGSPHVTLDRAGWALPARAALPPGAALFGRLAAVVAVVIGLGFAWTRRR